MIERYKLQDNFDQLGALQTHMQMGQDSNSLREFNNIQKQDDEKVNSQCENEGNSRRGLRGSVMKQQLVGGKGSFGRSNSMLDELKNIQQEIKLKRQMTSDFSSFSDNQEQNKSNNDFLGNQVDHNVLSKPSYISKDAELSSEIKQSLPLDQSFKRNQDNSYSTVSTLDIQVPISDGYKINNLNLNAQNSSGSLNNGYQNSVDNSFANGTEQQSQNNTINISNKNSDHKVDQNDLEEEQNHLNQNQEFPIIHQNLNFIHKQVKGVLEQEGYIVEESAGLKQLEQLHILESQRQIIKQASIDYNNSKESFQFLQNDDNVDKDNSSGIYNNFSHPLKGKGQFNHTQKENKKSSNPSKYKNMSQVDRRKSEGNQYLSFSERNIASISELKEKLEQSHERRHSVSEQTENDNKDKRSLLRKNVFLTNAITKSPCQSENQNDQQINIEFLDEDNTKNENPKSEKEIKIIFQNEGNQREEGNSQLESFYKRQKSYQSEEIDQRKQQSSPSSSSSATSLSENETERRISSLNYKSASGGGESSRNRSMRMNIGWGSATKNKNDSSDGDNEEDNNSEKQYQNRDSKLLKHYQTFSKRGTVDLDQEEQEGREKSLKLNLNYEYDNNYQNESDGDDENEERSEDNDRGSSTTKNDSSYYNKFQKYYTQNSNFQFDSIEEMESSQESIKKSTTKNSWKAKYPGTTRSMPKTDHPSSFFQYINMRKSRKRKSNVVESTDDFQQDLERNESSGSPEHNFSGCIDRIDESLTDLNINLDQSYNLKNSLHKSQTQSAQNSSSKQSQNGGAFQFNLNLVKIDPLLNTNLLGLAKLAESKSNSPKSDNDKSDENKKEQILKDNIPSMMGLPNSTALINNYLFQDFNQDFINLKNHQKIEKERNTQLELIEEQQTQIQNINKIQDLDSIKLENKGLQNIGQENTNKQQIGQDNDSKNIFQQTQINNAINITQINDNQQSQSLFTLNISPQQINLQNVIAQANEVSINQINLSKNDNNQINLSNTNQQRTNSPQIVNSATISQSQTPIQPIYSNENSLSYNQNSSQQQQQNILNQQQISTSLFNCEGTSKQIDLLKKVVPSFTSVGQNDSPLITQQNSNVNDLYTPIKSDQQDLNNILTNKEQEESKPRADSILFVNLAHANSPSVKTHTSFQSSFILNNDQKLDNYQISDSNLQQITNSPASQFANLKTIEVNDFKSYSYQSLSEVKNTQEKLYPQIDIIFEDQPKRTSYVGLIQNGISSDSPQNLTNIKENIESKQNLNSQNSQFDLQSDNSINMIEMQSLENGFSKLQIYQSFQQLDNFSLDKKSTNPYKRLSFDLKYLNQNINFQSNVPSSSIQKGEPLESNTLYAQTAQSQSEIERSKYVDNILQEYRKKMSISSTAALNNIEAKQTEPAIQNTIQAQDNLNQSKDSAIQNLSFLNNAFTNSNQTIQDINSLQTSISHNILSNLSVNNNQSYINLDNDLKNSFPANLQNGSNLMLSSLSQKSNYNLIGLQKSVSHAYKENQDEIEQIKEENDQQICDKYNGEYKDNLKHGYGSITYNDGKSYVGNFSNDKKDGFGQEYDSNKKLIYQGELQDDQYHGYGILHNDISQQSQNIITHENLSSIDNQWIQYDGQFNQGIKQGKGKIKFINNDIYDGYLNNNIPEGYGEFIYSHGKIEKGVWKNGIFKKD